MEMPEPGWNPTDTLLERRSPLSAQDQEALAWARKHRENIILRNSILKWTLAPAFIIGNIIGIAGFLNYYMLLQVPNLLPQFFAELGLLVPLCLINFKLVIKLGGNNNDAWTMMAWAVVCASAWAAAWAAAVWVLAWTSAWAVVLVWTSAWAAVVLAAAWAESASKGDRA
jgi:hypothetical protein